jgi:type I restriction enzyme S subunit
MKIYLDPRSQKIVAEILKKNGIHENVFVFGSRARGDHKEYSDLDLISKQTEPLQTQKLIQIKEDFKNSQLPIAVDFIEWAKISDDFRKKIEPELVAF